MLETRAPITVPAAALLLALAGALGCGDDPGSGGGTPQLVLDDGTRFTGETVLHNSGSENLPFYELSILAEAPGQSYMLIASGISARTPIDSHDFWLDPAFAHRGPARVRRCRDGDCREAGTGKVLLTISPGFQLHVAVATGDLFFDGTYEGPYEFRCSPGTSDEQLTQICQERTDALR